MQINSVVSSIQISGIRQFFNYANSVPNSVGLTLGQPDWPTPERIKNAAVQAIQDNQTVYTANAGLFELRSAASTYYSKHGRVYAPENEIIVTVGASQALDSTFRALLQPGDEVIVPAPAYPGYAPLIALSGATPVWIDTTATGFKITVEQIERATTSKTKAILLPYPSNPTGVVLTKSEADVLADYLATTNLHVISDEIYSDLVYGCAHQSFSQYPALYEQAVIIQGVSKSHSMTGWRIGFVLCNPTYCEQITKVQQYNVSCASSISQWAAFEALSGEQLELAEMNAAYEKRRNFLYGELQRLGLECVHPQ
ncbi:MAG: aminotransferase class I/II-fold pyridoxal phosphate-dependent enzyme, partial [Bacilli bacterium]